ncbi:50S ribosomal protein L5 [Candidatus Bathyarchaeota archaeon]|nr:MAG: 50S ribosomal protein L5 [Candidatus Bathyarchaeota archaeon]
MPSRSPRTRHRRKKPRILRKDHLHQPRDLRAPENRENRDRRGRFRNPRRIRNTGRDRCTARHTGEVIAVQTTETATKTNPLLNIRIEKVTINIATGKSGEPLEKAKKVLNQLTNKTPTTKLAKKAIKDWGIRKGEPIATVVTLRRDDAGQFLTRALDAVSNKVNDSCFDDYGNFSFGIKEHIEIPGTRYMPELGIFGATVHVTRRSGNIITSRRRRLSSSSRTTSEHK